MHFKNQTNFPSFLSWETNFHSRIEVPSFDSRPRVYAQAWTFWRQFTWCLESACSAPSWLSLPTSSYTPMQVRTHGGGSSGNRATVLMVDVFGFNFTCKSSNILCTVGCVLAYICVYVREYGTRTKVTHHSSIALRKALGPSICAWPTSNLKLHDSIYPRSSY